MKTFAVHNCKDKRCGNYRALLAAKRMGKRSFACHMARQMSDLFRLPANALIVLPEGVLTSVMADCFKSHKTIVIPKRDRVPTKSLNLYHRYHRNPYVFPREYDKLIACAPEVIIADDVMITGSTQYHLYRHISGINRAMFGLVWLMVSG